MNLFLHIELYHICVQFGYTENEQVYGASVKNPACSLLRKFKSNLEKLFQIKSEENLK